MEQRPAIVKKETDDMIRQLESLNYQLDLDIKSYGDLETPTDNQGNVQVGIDSSNPSKTNEELGMVNDQEYLFLRIHSDGTCIDNLTNVPEMVPAENPSDYFKQKLHNLYLKKSRAYDYSKYYENDNKFSGKAFIATDKIVENGVYI